MKNKKIFTEKHIWIFSAWTNWQTFKFGLDWVYLFKNGGLMDLTFFFGPFGFGWTKYKDR